MTVVETVEGRVGNRRAGLALLVALIAGVTTLMAATVDAGAATNSQASLSSAGVQANGPSAGPMISGNGQFVVFGSLATNLVAGDANDGSDIFRHDRLSGETRRVSVAGIGAEANDESFTPSISFDGRYVTFSSYASNLVPGGVNGDGDIFVRDLVDNATELISVGLGGAADDFSWGSSISANGRFVAFGSEAGNLVADDTNGVFDVFVRDRENGVTELVSVGTGGTQGDEVSLIDSNQSISADGRYVVFSSYAENLVAGDTNQAGDIFVRDREDGSTVRVSRPTGAGESNGESFSPVISADGRYVAFHSFASNLVPGDTNGVPDIFVHNLQEGTTERVNLGPGGAQSASEYSVNASISADGRHVAFRSSAGNLVDGLAGSEDHVYIRDREAGTTELASAGAAGVPGNNWSDVPSISADGRFLAFESHASNLVSGVTNDTVNIFIRDRQEVAPPPIVSPKPVATLRLGKLNRKKNGTATIRMRVSAAGRVEVLGSKQVRKAGKRIGKAGNVTLRIKAKGKAQKRLRNKGRVKVRIRVRYRPAAGKVITRTKRVTLRRR